MPRSSLRQWLPLVVCAAVLAGCSRSSETPAGPATPAPAPPQTRQLAGVTPAGPIAMLAADTGTGAVAGLSSGRTEVTLYDPASPRTARLPAPASGLAPGKPGEFLAPARDTIFRIDARTAQVTQLRVAGEVRAAAHRPDGTIAAALTDGTVRVVRPDGSVAHTISGLPAADALAPSGDAMLALNRTRSAVTALNVTAGKPGATLGAGDGGGNIIDGGAGRVFATDTRGGALLVFSAAPLVLRQRFPVGSAPYALAYDQRTGLVWVTLTASNEAVAYDVSTGIPVEIRRHPTVRQPDSIAVGGRTGIVYVGSATGDGLQQIGAR